jgi:hypothetical protein
MSIGPLLKVKAATAFEICARFDLKKEARFLLREGMSPREFIEALMVNNQYVTGIDFLAHALPTREAVWWGCLCLQHACGDRLSTQDKVACRAAVCWILEPTEQNSLAAHAPAETAGPGSSAGALAGAVEQTIGDLVPPKGRPMPSGAFAPAKAVARGVKLASIKGEPAKIGDTQRLYHELGIGVAEGRFVWPKIWNRVPVRK